jgi:hypothetical protein
MTGYPREQGCDSSTLNREVDHVIALVQLIRPNIGVAGEISAEAYCKATYIWRASFLSEFVNIKADKPA